MNTFLCDLYSYISRQALPIRNNSEYDQAFKEYLEIEKEIKEKVGADLLYQYQDAETSFFYQQNLAIFSKTIHFCQCFFSAVLD